MDYNRPNWIEYFIKIAEAASARSHDLNTKCGCVLTTVDNRILSVGYNSFPRELNDYILPSTRPDKYRFTIHSEMNALHNMSSKEFGFICYVTGEPCFNCLINLYQCGCSKIIHSDFSKPKCCETQEQKDDKDLFFRSLNNKTYQQNITYKTYNNINYTEIKL